MVRVKASIFYARVLRTGAGMVDQIVGAVLSNPVCLAHGRLPIRRPNSYRRKGPNFASCRRNGRREHGALELHVLPAFTTAPLTAPVINAPNHPGS